MSNINLDEINKIQENIYKIMNKCKEDNNSYLTDKNKKINKILSLIDSNFEKKQKEIGKEELEIRVKESNIIKFNLYNEILKSNTKLKHLISQNSSEYEILNYLQDVMKFETIKQNALKNAKEGLISYKEIEEKYGII